MSRNKTAAANEGKPPGATSPAKPVESDKRGVKAPPAKTIIPPPPPLFRKIDWISFAVTTLIILLGYIWTLAPDVTLEDSGELAVGSYYAGVPHPPGYPVWTLYTWLFTVIVPISNIAWRVALSSAVASAISCGLIALLVSRGSSMMIEGIAGLKNLEKRWESALCMVAGFVAGALMGFNGFMWSQSVIVEVYTLSVLSLMGVLCCLLRWIYAPHQRKYLYWTMFLFGICFTNHQTLLVAAMGIQVAIICANPKLGRDMMLFNVGFYILGLVLKSKGIITTFDSPPGELNMIFVIFNMVGIFSMLALGWLYFKTETLLTEWKPVVISGLCWAIGAGFYFYMPIASMTNPPMNWGYARTVEGFKHALSRGQYEKANPSNFIKEPKRFVQQLWGYGGGAVEEFNLVYLAIAIIPFVFLLQMQHRERAWIIGLSAIYLCLAVILLILLNPQPDKQSVNLNKVFFTSSHVMLSMFIGYGLTLGSAWLMLNYKDYRHWAFLAGGAAVFISLWVLLVVFETESPGVATGETPFYRFGIEPSFDPLVRFTAIFGVALAVLFVALLAVSREQFPIGPMLALFALMPMKSVLSHWDGNEQRGHLFGYWFGHDMFTPPFGIYPEMAKDAVLFGGTDPGRFNPTYMIFCESFIPPSKKRDPEFDRRDVYLITQNALADGTYLSYIRAHYFRSAQEDPPFFQNLPIGPLKTLAKPLDSFFIWNGERTEKNRRAEGVYPAKEIYTPSLKDSQIAFDEYIQDAMRRMREGKLAPGEEVRQEGNRVSVGGQISVMAINGLLTKVIFDKNPGHEFYVEESFPLQWMYPYQTPFGIIMKINREPVKEFTEEILKKDNEFWSKYSERLIGNWVKPDTKVSDICEFAERVYRRRNYEGFTGDRKFVRDENGQKAFSKLRSAIAGLYVWRINHCAEQIRAIQSLPGPEQAKLQGELQRVYAEQQRVIREAEFAYKQSFAFCPYSPEAIIRYSSLLTSLGKYQDAYNLVETGLKFDPENGTFQQFRESLKPVLGQPVAPATSAAHVPQSSAGPKAPVAPPAIQELEQKAAANPDDLQAAFNVITAYISMGNTNRAVQLLQQVVTRKPDDFTTVASAAQAYMHLKRPQEATRLLDRLLTQTNLDAGAVTTIAHMYSQIGDALRLESTLTRLTAVLPDSPEAWFDLAAIRAAMGNKNPDALKALSKAIQLSNTRRVTDPNAGNLVTNAQADPRFQILRSQPGFDKALSGSY